MGVISQQHSRASMEQCTAVGVNSKFVCQRRYIEVEMGFSEYIGALYLFHFVSGEVEMDAKLGRDQVSVSLPIGPEKARCGRRRFPTPLLRNHFC